MKKKGLFTALVMIVLILSACSFATTKKESTKKTPSIAVTIQVTQNEGKEKLETKKVHAKKGTTLYQMLQDNFKIADDKGMITSINGVSQDEKAGRYWFIEINGKFATKGAKETKPKNGDKVSFDLHEAN
ncbi:DUF4430 domain-containing protein [Listeria aquatica]|uniref:DUF4430 domain-containing protein n=1 Tax=Listeria aquatica TaxID=1494960 RepID=UPI003F71113F